MKIIVLATAGMSVLLLSGCCSKELSRAKAKGIIVEKLKKLPAETNQNAVTIYAEGATNADQVLAAPSSRYEKLLIEDGMLTATWAGISKDVFGNPRGSVTLSVTDKGAAYKTGTANTIAGPVNVFEVCEVQFQEVTGISANGDNTEATVEYTWKYGNLTPFGRRRQETNPRSLICDQAIQKGPPVVMRRYDDGWRIPE